MLNDKALTEIIACLRAGYRSEEWERYAETFPAALSPAPGIPDDAWRVIYNWHLDETRARGWLRQPLPALANAALVDLLELDDGLDVLRAFLMRLPW